MRALHSCAKSTRVAGNFTQGQLEELHIKKRRMTFVAQISMRSAQNTMDTRGTPELHPGLVAPLVRGPK